MNKPFRKRPLFWLLLILIPIIELAIWGAMQNTYPYGDTMTILVLALFALPVVWIAIIILAIRKEPEE
jgi:hypothetical protein